MVDEGSQNDRLSQEILNKLSEELEQESQAKEPDSTIETEPVGDSASSNRTMSPEEIAAAFASAAPAQEPEPAEAPASNRTMSPEEIATGFPLDWDWIWFLAMWWDCLFLVFILELRRGECPENIWTQ